jgi:oligosaccharyltransferase complex subunit beta
VCWPCFSDWILTLDPQVYDIDISTFSGEEWTPYTANDVQLEFTMLDPHLRLPLAVTPRTSNSTVTSNRFSTQFRTPDKHGVFTLKVDYRRPGWSYLQEKSIVSITPPRHDEYDRFIKGALPYYASAFSVAGSVLIFVVMWLLQ